MFTVHRSRALLLFFAAILVMSLLAACGGDDDDSSGGGNGGDDVPVPSGAEQLAEQDMSPDDFGDSDVDLAEGKTVAYRVSGMSFDEVSAFYESGIEDDGWTSVNHIAVSGVMLSVISKDMTIVVATAMTGATAKEQADTFGLEELDINEDDIADEDILVVVGDLGCEEDAIEACVSALDLGI